MHSLYMQEKYISLMASSLQKFKKVRSGLFNFRCPFCGDSDTDKNKARGYLYRDKKSAAYKYKCHNCSINHQFKFFLKTVDPILEKQYNFELFNEGSLNKTFEEFEQFSKDEVKKKKVEKNPLLKLKKVSQLPSDHPAKLYVENRKIPYKHHHRIYYCSKFKKWVDQYVDDTIFKDYIDSIDRRLIIPFLDEDGEFFGCSARSIEANPGLRYISIMADETKLKIFGLDKCDKNKVCYIFEGALDSMFIDNSLAMAGADVPLKYFEKFFQPVFIYDNEPRNEEIVKNMLRTVNEGYSVCVWDASFTSEKDVNNMVLREGKSQSQIQEYINRNTFSDLKAKARIGSWKKCKVRV